MKAQINKRVLENADIEVCDDLPPDEIELVYEDRLGKRTSVARITLTPTPEQE